MKKLIFALLLIGSAVALFYACKKDTVVSSNKTSFEMSENGKVVYNKLVKFKHEMENPQKNGTLMSVDSAQWYIEAYYNVTSGYPDSTYHSFEIDSANYTINVDENNMISISDIAVLISIMESHLTIAIDQSSFDIGHMVVGDVYIDNSSRSSDLVIFVNTGLGLGLGSFYTPFPDNVCWFYGMTAGHCDVPNPTPPYADAGDEMEWRFNNPNPIYVPYPNCENGSVKIIGTSNYYIKGYNHPLIYSEWYPGALEYPGYYGPYWNVFLNYGTTLFYNSIQNGGLIPDGSNFFTSIDITTGYQPYNENGIDGYRYYHAYNTYYSIYECIPLID